MNDGTTNSTIADTAPLASLGPAASPVAALKPPLDLANYPVIRQLSLTDHDCDLVSRVLTIVLNQCQKSVDDAATDAVVSLGAIWLRDEIKRVGTKFATQSA